MARPKIENSKIYIRLPQARVDEVKALANEIGMNYTNFGGMLLWLGYRAYLRQIRPESQYTPEQLARMAKFYEEMQEDNSTD